MPADEPTGVADLIAAARLLPVIVIDDDLAARRLGLALLEGGLGLAEVTFRTPGAEKALRAMASVPDLCVGAGTVLNVEQADRAIRSGARFVVSPGLNADVVRRCIELSTPVFPGVATPTEIMSAMELGVDTVKLFPAAVIGGPAALSALAGPFPQMRFIPTGGITASTAPSYLGHSSVLAVGGSWMAPADLVRAGRWQEIAALTREAVAAVHTQEVSR
jgi:2-dehydro-3-deoxyphosphogluconate aldolase/(4S)-4-hydroxy-2-oxoglutarate aldolase